MGKLDVPENAEAENRNPPFDSAVVLRRATLARPSLSLLTITIVLEEACLRQVVCAYLFVKIHGISTQWHLFRETLRVSQKKVSENLQRFK